jgi:hypothetical protein
MSLALGRLDAIDKDSGLANVVIDTRRRRRRARRAGALRRSGRRRRVSPVRLIGVLRAEQTEKDGKTLRNDRLVGVVETPYNPPEVRALDQLSKQRLEEIEHFFISYNAMEGRRFRPVGRGGPDEAARLVAKHAHREDAGPGGQHAAAARHR